jgi:hypothetical protein
MLPLQICRCKCAHPTGVLNQLIGTRTPQHPSRSSCTLQATAKAEPEALQRRRAAGFLKAYEPFDWTAQL